MNKNAEAFKPQLTLFQLLACLTVAAVTCLLVKHYPVAFALVLLSAVIFLVLVVLTLLVVLLLTILEVLMQLPEYLSGGALWLSESQPRRKRMIDNPYRSPFTDEA